MLCRSFICKHEQGCGLVHYGRWHSAVDIFALLYFERVTLGLHGRSTRSSSAVRNLKQQSS